MRTKISLTIFSVAAIVLLVLLAGVALTSPAQARDKGARKVVLHDPDGNRVAEVRLVPRRDGVQVWAKVRGLPPGFHGFHVHAVGQCSPDFTAAGGHFNPAGASHRDHAGDMPVLLVNEDGTAEATFKTDRFTIGDLFDDDGSAIIIHAAPDNYANIPDRYSNPDGVPDGPTLATGDAGGRLACGVVR